MAAAAVGVDAVQGRLQLYANIGGHDTFTVTNHHTPVTTHQQAFRNPDQSKLGPTAIDPVILGSRASGVLLPFGGPQDSRSGREGAHRAASHLVGHPVSPPRQVGRDECVAGVRRQDRQVIAARNAAPLEPQRRSAVFRCERSAPTRQVCGSGSRGRSP